MIRNVGSRVKPKDVSELVAAEQKGDKVASRKLDALLAETEVIFGSPLPENLIARAPQLKWIQSAFAGVERLMDNEIVKSQVVVTNARGMHSQVADL